MKKFHIITNSTKDPDGVHTSEIKEKLIKLGAESVTVGETYNPEENADIILVLGGDGTLLRAAGETFGMGVPLLGVNLGTLGYLAEAEMADIDEVLQNLFEDKVMIEERMMLCGNVRKHSDVAGQVDITPEDHCLNDVVITGCAPLSLIRYEIYVNDEFLNSYSADGLVIATPTGSTGYNMSAGGPIVEPRSNIIVITPICPHTLNTRSIVLSAADRICVKIADTQKDNVAVLFDGREPYLLAAGECVSIERSVQVTRIVKLRRESFLNTLHNKLS